MAGNPFRRTAVAASNEEHGNEPRIDTTSWATKDGNKTKAKKKVTIQTPPHSPEQTQRSSSAGRVSPPPSVSLPNEVHDSTSATTDEAELDEAVENMRRNQDSLLSQASGPIPVVGRAPYNPFARTLATSEASFGRNPAGSEPLVTHRAEQDHEQGQPTRQPLNVDDFKDILLHGSTTPIAGRNAATQAAQENSSSTGTSTASQRSLFDSNYDVGFGSPRTSLEHLESPSEDEYEDDEQADEAATLMKGTGRLDDLAPPAPPKRVQSPATEPRGPRTVSFDEFEASMNATPSQKPVNGFRRPNRPTELGRSESDLNKPLPPPPIPPNALQGPKAQAHVSSPLGARASAPKVEAPQAEQHTKRTPPPPPVSRRKGVETATQSHLMPSPGPDTFASSQADPSRQVLLTPALSETKSMPPRPPRRNATRTGSSADRSPSSVSQSSSRRSSHTSMSHTTPTAPPAPPPRRGGSNHRTSASTANSGKTIGNIVDSLDGRRGSGNSFTSERSTSLSNLQGVVEDSEAHDDVVPPAPQSSSAKFLDDMDAFQAEVDALRAKQDKGG